MSLEVLDRPKIDTPKLPEEESGEVTTVLPKQSLPRAEFAMDPNDHRLYKRYQPKLAGHGGEQAVYVVPRFPHQVIKVNFRLLKPLLDQYPLPETPAQEKALLQKLGGEVLGQQAAYERLVSIFGREHLLAERVTKMRLPVTQALVEDVLGESAPNLPDSGVNFPFVVRIQELVPQYILDTGLDMRSGYAEKHINDSLEKESYARGSLRWLSDEPDDTPFDPELFLECQGSTALANLINVAKTEPALKLVIVDFLEKAMEYTRVTGLILDLAGENNVVFFQDAETKEWDYRLIDASFPDRTKGQIGIATGALENYIDREKLTEIEYMALYNALNYTRTVNGLADAMGMSERINLLHNKHISIDLSVIDWDELRQYLVTQVRGE